MSEIILVTGFGPFRDHNINASWEAVKLLPDKIDQVILMKQEVPVTYEHVEKIIPNLWNDFNPLLVIHVGVSSHTSKLVIEKSANRTGYVQKDVSGQLHPSGIVCCDGEDCISTEIDVNEISNFINVFTNVKTTVSINAGRYLCEFIYYTSLNIDKTKTLFIHVPPVDKPYTVQELSNGLLEVIKGALKQIKDRQAFEKETTICSCSMPIHSTVEP